MFANLKEKLNERLKTLTVPTDPVERRLYETVDRATSDVLIGPDWALNMELVDLINSNPSATLEKATKVLTRPLQSSNRKVQLLTLTLLETCIKNCTRQFHRHLSSSELFSELLRIADPPPNAPASSEVKDRVLCLIEDLAKALDGPYRRAYESLLDSGVDFPVRASEDIVPLEIPPEGAAPSADISEEDRAAIAAAMAELDAQAQAQQQQQPQPQQRQPPAAGAPVQGVPVAGFPRLVSPRLVGRAPPQQQPAPQPAAEELPPLQPQPPAEVVKTAKAAGELLGEILQSVKAEGQAASVREPYISEMADQCKAQRSQLQEMLASNTDLEAVFEEALAANESLQKALDQYNELLALVPAPAADPARSAAAATALAAHGIPQHRPDYAAPTYVPPSMLPRSTAAPTPPSNPSPAFACPQFTLDDDDDEDTSLLTKRQPAAVALPMPVLPPPPSSAVAPAMADLIDFGSESGSPTKAAAPAPPAAGGVDGDALLDEMDRLMRDSSLNPQEPAAKQS